MFTRSHCSIWVSLGIFLAQPPERLNLQGPRCPDPLRTAWVERVEQHAINDVEAISEACFRSMDWIHRVVKIHPKYTSQLPSRGNCVIDFLKLLSVFQLCAYIAIFSYQPYILCPQQERQPAINSVGLFT